MAQASNPWDRPTPVPTVGNETQEEIFLSVGRALSQWERIDNMLVMLFTRITDMEFKLALEIYGALYSSSGKSDILMAACKANYPAGSDHLIYLNKLLILVGKFRERRNDIAHGTVTPEGHSWLLTPPFHNWKNYNRLSNNYKYAYRAEHIDTLCQHFTHLYDEVSDAFNLFMKWGYDEISPATVITSTVEPEKSKVFSNALAIFKDGPQHDEE